MREYALANKGEKPELAQALHELVGVCGEACPAGGAWCAAHGPSHTMGEAGADDPQAATQDVERQERRKHVSGHDRELLADWQQSCETSRLTAGATVMPTGSAENSRCAIGDCVVRMSH